MRLLAHRDDAESTVARRMAEAMREYARALELTNNAAERRRLELRLRECESAA